MRLHFEGGHYSRAASIHRNTVDPAMLMTLAQTGLSVARIWWWCQKSVTEDEN